MTILEVLETLRVDEAAGGFLVVVVAFVVTFFVVLVTLTVDFEDVEAFFVVVGLCETLQKASGIWGAVESERQTLTWRSRRQASWS